jgi:hypothetical protein
MFDDVIGTLRAWLEGVRQWALGQSWLSPFHEWIGTAHVSTIWAIIVVVVVMLVFIVGFWPPAKDPTPMKRAEPPRDQP